MAILLFLFGAVVSAPFFIYVYMMVVKHKTQRDDFYVAIGGLIMGASFFVMALYDVNKIEHPEFVVVLGLFGSSLASFNTLRMLRSIRNESVVEHKA